MRLPLANGSFNTNLLRDYLQNDPLRNIYNLDPSVIKSFAQDLSPRAAQAAKDASGYTRPYGDDPNLFIKDLDKFGMQPTGPLYGAPIMDDAWLDSPAYEIGMNSPGDIGSTSVSGVNRRPQTYREMMHAYLNEGKGSYKRDFATQGMIEDNPTITERNKQIGETIGHEARHQLLADNPEFYEDIDDSLVANIGATGTDKHEILNRMLDFQAYNDPDVYKDIYEDMHGDMPRHLSSPIADKFSEQATAFTDKMLQPYQKPKYSPQWDFPGSDPWGTRRMAEEKMDPERPQKKGLWDSITGGITNVLDNTMIGKIGAANNPFNPRAWNYQPGFRESVDAYQRQGMLGDVGRGPYTITRGPMAGRNMVSMFGSNNYRNMISNRMNKQGLFGLRGPNNEIRNQKRYNELKAELKKETQRQNQQIAPASGMSYNQVVDAMVQDRSPEMQGRPGGIGGKELMARGGIAGLWPR
jgi:hypothetical protein